MPKFVNNRCLVVSSSLLLNKREITNDKNRHCGPHEQLSEREFQVFLKLAKGETAGDIAKTLSLSVKTVSTYRTRLMEKMNLSSNSDLTYYALKTKLID